MLMHGIAQIIGLMQSLPIDSWKKYHSLNVRDEIGIPDQPALAIFDAFSGHSSEALNSLLEDNKILVVKVPAGCTDELQPLLTSPVHYF